MAEKTLRRKGKTDILPREEIDAAIEDGLSARTKALMADSESDATLANYGAAWALFVNWCEDYGGRGADGVRRRGLSSLPASPETMAEFVGFMAHEGFAPSSIEIARAAVHRMHRIAGEQLPDGAKASAALRGYKRRLRQAGWRPKQAIPARTWDLERFLEPVDLTTAQGLRDRAIILLGYAVAARRRVIVNLNVPDFTELQRNVFKVRITRDKGDHDRECILEHWGEPRKGRCKDPLCPVCAVLVWLASLRELGVDSGPLFRGIDRHGNVGGVHKRGTPREGADDGRLVLRSVNSIVERMRVAAGLPRGYTPHSLRAGFATEQYELGTDRAWIEDQGGWARGSRAFWLYVRDIDQRKHNALTNLRAQRRAALEGS